MANEKVVTFFSVLFRYCSENIGRENLSDNASHLA